MLKSESSGKKIGFLYLNERPLNMMKNAFCFMLKALLALQAQV